MYIALKYNGKKQTDSRNGNSFWNPSDVYQRGIQFLDTLGYISIEELKKDLERDERFIEYSRFTGLVDNTIAYEVIAYDENIELADGILTRENVLYFGGRVLGYIVETTLNDILVNP